MPIPQAAAAIWIRAAVSDRAGNDEARHVPVMLREAMAYLNVREGGVYVDGTFGAGGYARAILAVPDTRLVAIDRDPAAAAAAREMAAAHSTRMWVHEGRFSEMEEALRAAGLKDADGVVLDLGVSSMQLDEAARGFSFRHEGPLDMRMEGTGPSATEVVNTLPEAELADIIFTYGEERRARAIARAIARARTEAPIATTCRLAEIVESVLGRKRPGQVHPATRTFQALRIFVNRELEELAAGLAAAERVLKPGGRLVVVTFHSLEDRIVKRFIAERSGRAVRSAQAPRRLPPVSSAEPPTPSFEDLAKGGVTPTAAEVAANPRARSARLRAARRTTAPPVPLNEELLGVPRVPVRSGGRRLRGGKGRR